MPPREQHIGFLVKNVKKKNIYIYIYIIYIHIVYVLGSMGGPNLGRNTAKLFV